MTAQLLLVDDEPSLRQAVQAYLSESGFKARVAANAQEGWQQLEQLIPDLVITDVMMPQVNGYQFLKQLRDDMRFKSLPVVFLTARGMTSDRIQGYQAGCDAYLSKPFDPDELVAIIENLLKRKQDNIANDEGEPPDITEMARQITEIKALLTQQGTFSRSPAVVS